MLQLILARQPEIEEPMEEDLRQLLSQFGEVFKEPKGLSPPMSKDHKIVLKDGIPPICNRPYQYLHYQKSEIEKNSERVDIFWCS